MKNSVFIFLVSFFLFTVPSEAKKIKSALKVEKETKTVKNKNSVIGGREILVDDSGWVPGEEADSLTLMLRNISFAGYEKECNSSKESFLMHNPTDETIVGFLIKIDYYDLKNRMLHSRKVKEDCYIPPGEARKLDIKSWDQQHSYYYYLGNEPKKVATPYKVAFTPISYWIEL